MFQIIPEWAPNVHPMIVHFPIGLLVIAVLLDVLQWIKPLRNRLDGAVLLLYLFGLIGAAAAFWSGRVAADTVRVTTEAQTVLSDHDDRALVTLIFFAAFFVVRLLIRMVRLDRKWLSRWVMPVVGIAGLVLLWQTAELGKELVYKHGVGVAAVVIEEEEEIDLTDESRWEDRDDGWLWHAGQNASEVFRERIEFRGDGAEERLHLHTREDEEGYCLEIEVTAAEGPLFLLFPEEADDISLEMVINADDFEGRLGLVHHFDAPARFEFLDYDGNDVRLGRHEAGEDEILDEGHAHLHGWVSLRVAADGRHFYAYADEEMIAHGHATPWESGDTGVFLHGAGSVGIRMLHLVELREAPHPDRDHDGEHDHEQQHEHDHNNDNEPGNDPAHDHAPDAGDHEHDGHDH